MSRKQKLENKTYSTLLDEGYLIIPVENRLERLRNECRHYGFEMILFHFLVPANPASPDEAQQKPDTPKYTINGEVKVVIDKPKRKRGRPRKEKAVEVLLNKIATHPLITEISLKDIHPLADFEVKTPCDATVANYFAQLGTRSALKSTLKETVETLLSQTFGLSMPEHAGDMYNLIYSFPDHPNKKLILGILKPEGEVNESQV